MSIGVAERLILTFCMLKEKYHRVIMTVNFTNISLLNGRTRKDISWVSCKVL